MSTHYLVHKPRFELELTASHAVVLPLHYIWDNLEPYAGFEPAPPAWKAEMLSHYTNRTYFRAVDGTRTEFQHPLLSYRH